MQPAVAEVVQVHEFIADLGEYLIEAHVRFGGPSLTFVHLELAQVVLGVVAPEAGTTSESVLVRNGPSEGRLNDLVDLVEEQVDEPNRSSRNTAR